MGVMRRTIKINLIVYLLWVVFQLQTSAQTNYIIPPERAQELVLERLSDDPYAPDNIHTLGTPQLIRRFEPSEAFLNSEEVEAMCLDSEHYKEPAWKGKELSLCLADLRDKDKYEVRLYDKKGRYIQTETFPARRGEGGSWGTSHREKVITRSQAQELLGTDKIELYTLNIDNGDPANWIDFEWVLWLADTRAVDYYTGDVLQVVDMEGNPVSLLDGDVAPIIVEKGNETTRPMIAFPIGLELYQP